MPSDPKDSSASGPDPDWAEVTIHAEAEDSRVSTLPAARGSTIGRYVVVDRVSTGGMGVVYAAYDPELDRKVALKVLHPGSKSSTSTRAEHAGEGRAARLIREAQAMAKLAHPNVVTVHDVGTIDERVFLAMEFIDGWTAKEWILKAERSWREVLDVFIRAGRGIAAAHAVGLVHRDFKPENVLIGRDERVVVADFGLARPSGATDTELSMSKDTGDIASGPVVLHTDLTRTGAIMGTPAYMAPEQHRGKRTDARTDVFGFCVALYEGVYGERPFSGETLPALAANVLDGRVRDAPRDSRVPGWLRRALLRGMSLKPEDRFQTVDALLVALNRDPARQRRFYAMMGGGLVGVAGLAFGVGHLRDQEAALCRGGEDHLAGVWDQARRTSMEGAFLATELPFAQRALDESSEALDLYAERWVSTYTDACEGTRVRGDQSESLMDLRMACLDRRLQELSAVTDLFARADAEVVEHASEAARDLTPIYPCSDHAALTAPIRAPDDPARKAQIASVREALARSLALQRAGKYQEALPIAERAAREADSIGYAPLQAEAHQQLGIVHGHHDHDEASKAELEIALAAAVAGHDDRRAALATTSLISTSGWLSLHDEALSWGRQAAGWIARLGNDPRLEARRLDHLGLALRKAGRYDDAAEHHARALELLESSGADERTRAGVVLHGADVRFRNGEYEAALELYREVLLVEEEDLGPDHPALIAVLNNMALAQLRLGRYGQSRANFERSLHIAERATGKDSVNAALAIGNIAMVALAEGHIDEAVVGLEQSIAIQRRELGDTAQLATNSSDLGIAYVKAGRMEEATEQFRKALAGAIELEGEEHPDVATTLNNLGTVLLEQGETEEGLRHLQRALRLKSDLLGSRHPLVASTLEALGAAASKAGDHRGALTFYLRSIHIIESSLGPDHVRLGTALVEIGHTYQKLGNQERALASLERAVAVREATAGDPTDLASARMALAEALWDGRSDRARALELGRAARDAFIAAGDREHEARDDAEKWLRKREALLQR